MERLKHFLFDDPRLKKAARIILFLAVIILLFQTYNKAYRTLGYDLTCYIESAQNILEGKNPYKSWSSFPFIYPLFAAVFFIPFYLMPYWLANFIWFALSVFSLVYIFKILLSFIREEIDLDNICGFLLFFIIIMFLPLQNNFLNGQINIILLLLILLFIKTIDKSALASSFFLSAAISLKITPAIFLFHLVINKKWTHLFYTLIFGLIMCIGLPALFLGNNLIPIYRDYFNDFILNSFKDLSMPHYFFSFKNFILWSLSQSQPAIYLSRLINPMIVLILMFLDYRYFPAGSDKNRIYIFNFYFLSILLISPMSETHHLVFLIPVTFSLFLKSITDQVFPDRKLLTAFIFWILLFNVMGMAIPNGISIFFAIIILYVFNRELILKLTRPN